MAFPQGLHLSLSVSLLNPQEVEIARPNTCIVHAMDIVMMPDFTNLMFAFIAVLINAFIVSCVN